MNINDILIEPLLTEKATNLAKNNIYVLKVNKKANKYQVKKAVEELFKVEVEKVTTGIIKGRKRRVGKKRWEKKISDYKLAYIKLKKGELPFFPKA